MMRRKCDEEIESDDGRGQHYRQGNECFDGRRKPPTRRIEPMRERKSDQPKHDRGDRRQPQCQPERLPQRKRQTEETGTGFEQECCAVSNPTFRRNEDEVRSWHTVAKLAQNRFRRIGAQELEIPLRRGILRSARREHRGVIERDR